MREERQAGRRIGGNIEARSTAIRNQSSARKGKARKFRAFMAYSGIFILVISFLAYASGNDAGSSTSISQNPAANSVATPKAEVANVVSVDQLAAASAVTDLAETTQLPSVGTLREATTSLSIKKDLSQNDIEVIAKPEIVKPDTSASRGITNYVTKEGESMDAIAKRFGISAQTLRWANNTDSDAVEPGRTLIVPLIDGVVYTVKDGDTPQSLAEKYKASAERIVLYNDLTDGSGLNVGAQIVLPGGELPENERPGYVAPRSRSSYGGGGYGYGYGGNVTASVGNRYAAGNCTWYSYERRAALGRPIGSFWGNAYSWASSARAAGFLVNNTPAPGAIFQTASGGGGYGHVGIVERVENGVVYVSDMNFAGYGVITHRTLPNPGSYNYIH